MGDFSGFSRRGHFLPSRLPGGDASVMEPWRYGLSLLAEVLGEETALQAGEKLWPGRKDMIPLILSVLRISPLTTSCGRFFDGVAALLGLVERISFDGQAAMALEGIAEGGRLSAPFSVELREGRFILDWRPAVRWVTENCGTMRKELVAGADAVDVGRHEQDHNRPQRPYGEPDVLGDHRPDQIAAGDGRAPALPRDGVLRVPIGDGSRSGAQA